MQNKQRHKKTSRNKWEKEWRRRRWWRRREKAKEANEDKCVAEGDGMSGRKEGDRNYEDCRLLLLLLLLLLMMKRSDAEKKRRDVIRLVSQPHRRLRRRLQWSKRRKAKLS